MINRLRRTLILSFLLITAGCQIQPLHSTNSLETNKATKTQTLLQSIIIEEPKSRLDQLVRNELNFKLSANTSSPNTNALILKLDSTKTIRSVGISDVDFGPRAFFVTVKSEYILSDQVKNMIITKGSQQGTGSYDRVDQEFANIRSERDAEIRAAKAAALRIRHALSLALSKDQ